MLMLLGKKDICLATSTRNDGNMSFLHGDHAEVLRNRENFLNAHAVSLEQCVFLRTPHESEVIIVDDQVRGRGTRSSEDAIVAEALITSTRGLTLCLMTADCFPLAYYDPMKHVIALAHLGWKPSYRGLAANVVREMRMSYGCDPADIIVHIGPGIQKGSYSMTMCPFSDDTRWRPFLQELRSGETSVDLPGIIRKQLTDSGILVEHIEASPRGTFGSPLYFSHSESVRQGIPEGRFLTHITLLA